LLTIAVLDVLYGIIVSLPTPAGLAWQGQRVLGVAALVIGLWCTEVLPTGVTSMLVLLLLVLSGAVPVLRVRCTCNCSCPSLSRRCCYPRGPRARGFSSMSITPRKVPRPWWCTSVGI